METENKTIYQELMNKGYSRREFLKFCGVMGAMLGLSQTGIAQMIESLQTKPRKSVIWYHFQECSCCSESFIRASHPVIGDMIMDIISLDYDDTLMAAAGSQAEAAKQIAIKKNYGKYIMLVEGSVPLGNYGYCMIGGKSAKEEFDEGAAGAQAIVAWGNCASAGCVQHAKPNPTHAEPVHKLVSGKPIINVQGCPPIADVMAGVITYMITFDKIPELDQLGRPLAFYGRRVHDTCYRRPNYDAGLFVQSFDDENAKKGYCLYYMGCKGPNTYNSCGVIKWNLGVSYPIQSGHGCIGCSEANFWDYGPFYKHIPHEHGFGIEATADKIGAGLAVAALGGIAAHAIATNIRKRRLIENDLDDFSLNKKEVNAEKLFYEKKIDELKKKDEESNAPEN